MSKECLYFKIIGGAVKAAYDKFQDLRKVQWEARQNLCKEFGAETTYANQSEVVGLVFNDGQTPPDGWKQVSGEPTVFKPHGNTAAMKAVRKRMREDYPLCDARKFQELVIGTDNVFYFMDGMSMRYMVFETISENLLLLVPKVEGGDSKGKWIPPDDGCIPLKTSEYWQLKESVACPA
jgi:hypothetical protein